jgi:hypothetical protein
VNVYNIPFVEGENRANSAPHTGSVWVQSHVLAAESWRRPTMYGSGGSTTSRNLKKNLTRTAPPAEDRRPRLRPESGRPGPLGRHPQGVGAVDPGNLNILYFPLDRPGLTGQGTRRMAHGIRVRIGRTAPNAGGPPVGVSSGPIPPKPSPYRSPLKAPGLSAMSRWKRPGLAPP